MPVSDRPHASCRRFGGAVELSGRGNRHRRVRRAQAPAHPFPTPSGTVHSPLGAAVQVAAG